uniref:Uncharacterized protein n=1 Tax=Rhizophora mucronata TaxID=61149 RepID=A0A2P2Q135_RHIMU
MVPELADFKKSHIVRYSVLD